MSTEDPLLESQYLIGYQLPSKDEILSSMSFANRIQLTINLVIVKDSKQYHKEN